MFSNDSKSKEPSFLEYLRVAYKNRFIIAGIFVLTVAVTAVFTFTAKKVYEARSTLLVEIGGRAGGLESIFGGRNPMQSAVLNEVLLNNQVEILRSRTLAERSVKKLRSSPDAQKLDLLRGDEGSASDVSVLRALSSSIEIAPIENTNVIQVRAKAGSPFEASLIANTIVDAYVETNVSWARGEVTEVKSFLEEQLELVRGRLSDAEDQLKNFQESKKVASLSDETEAAVKKVAEFEALKGQAEVDLEAAQRRMGFLESQLTTQKKSLIDDIGKVSAPVVTDLRGELANLEGIRARYLAQGYAENHEKMLEIERRIQDTKARLVVTTKDALASELDVKDPFSYSQGLVERILDLEVEVRTLKARVDGFKQIIAESSADLEKLPGTALSLARLERDKQVNEQILVMLMEKYEEARIKEAGQLGNATVVDRAEEPQDPILPRKRRNLMLGAVAGLLLGIIGAFSIERFRDRIADASDIEGVSAGVPLLASIPRIQNGRARFPGIPKRKRIPSPIGIDEVGVTRLLAAEADPRSPVSESYRTLRTNIFYSRVDEPVRTIVVTSPGPAEGKSTIVANLGVAMAQAGNRTVVVDSDLRRPTVSALLGGGRGVGLTDVLSGKLPLEQALTPTKVEGLFLLGSGPLPPNPSEMLGSRKMRQVIEELSERFEFVLFDSPPILPISDAAALGASVDGAILVVRSDVTATGGLSRALSLLKAVHTRIIGVVLNDLNIGQRLGDRYYHYYYSPHSKDHTAERPRA
jgi:tyrosine-protein kinase Etk/Wzc